MSNRIAVFNNGRIEQVGPPREIYDAPDDDVRRDVRRHVERADASNGPAGCSASTPPHALRPERIRVGATAARRRRGRRSTACSATSSTSVPNAGSGPTSTTATICSPACRATPRIGLAIGDPVRLAWSRSAAFAVADTGTALDVADDAAARRLDTPARYRTHITNHRRGGPHDTTDPTHRTEAAPKRRHHSHDRRDRGDRRLGRRRRSRRPSRSAPSPRHRAAAGTEAPARRTTSGRPNAELLAGAEGAGQHRRVGRLRRGRLDRSRRRLGDAVRGASPAARSTTKLGNIVRRDGAADAERRVRRRLGVRRRHRAADRRR